MTTWMAIASILLALAVLFGAFGAHGLADRLDAYSLGIWEKAVFYHFVHGLALFMSALAALVMNINTSSVNKICVLFLFGVIIFSGSLYALALTELRWLGAITPIGGIAFVIAWLWLALVFLKNNKASRTLKK